MVNSLAFMVSVQLCQPHMGKLILRSLHPYSKAAKDLTKRCFTSECNEIPRSGVVHESCCVGELTVR